jgi:hypothetical protein
MHKLKKIMGIPVTDAAKNMAIEFSMENKSLASVSEHLSSFLYKLHGTACRIAGILPFIELDNSSFCITERHMQQAILISKELIPHEEFATNPCGLMCIEAAKKIEDWYCGSNRVVFEYRDAKQALNSKYDSETVHSA